MEALSKVITLTGSQQSLARKVGATQQAVSLWLRRDPVSVSAEFVIRVAESVEFQVTPHELRLLKLLVEGHSYKTAAAELCVSRKTVSFHLQKIYEKLVSSSELSTAPCAP